MKKLQVKTILFLSHNDEDVIGNEGGDMGVGKSIIS
jgi:hypothetical protein